jgi:glycosyltransferase involved in cell wall biosynthesis
MSKPGQTVALCMIVRDEAAVLARCLGSIRDLVDSWVICDTGSTDDTVRVIERELKDLPGVVHRRPWVNFGHNRSELMRRARGAADYLLLIDADMTVLKRARLPRLTADAYLLREEGALDFGIPRLVRGDRDWWYEGPTHEYLCTDGEIVQRELPALAVIHHADGSSREGKLLRDLGLLKREVAAGRSTPRTTFYLAQTYRDLERVDPAIEWYRRRVELGGWDEEVFYANYQEGMLRLNKSQPEAVSVLLEAWGRRPTRAEPLYELARAYRERGEMAAAHLFASRGLEIPYPSDVLFVHRWVYEWGLRVERIISAMSIGRQDEATQDVQVLADQPDLPDHVRSFLTSVTEELALVGRPVPGPPTGARPSRLAALTPRLRIGEVKLDVRPRWPAFNPSIAADGAGFRMIVRTANYRIGRGVVHEDGLLRNINYLVAVDKNLAVTGIEPLVDGAEDTRRYPSEIEGYEDCRLFQVGDRWYASATACQFNPIDRREIVLLHLAGPEVTRVLPLSGPHPGRHEKNWMPFVRDGVLHFVYTCGPTVVLSCDVTTGRTDLVSQTPAPEWMEDMRGGSQGVQLPDGSFLFVVHEVDRSCEPARYVHRFVRLGRDLALDSVSGPFTFTSDLVEFCGGMAGRDDELVLSFGVSDAACGLGVIALADALALLHAPTGQVGEG